MTGRVAKGVIVPLAELTREVVAPAFDRSWHEQGARVVLTCRHGDRKGIRPQLDRDQCVAHLIGVIADIVAMPLPEHPELRGLAEELERARRVAEIFDEKWRLVYISSELATVRAT